MCWRRYENEKGTNCWYHLILVCWLKLWLIKIISSEFYLFPERAVQWCKDLHSHVQHTELALTVGVFFSLDLVIASKESTKWKEQLSKASVFKKNITFFLQINVQLHAAGWWSEIHKRKAMTATTGTRATTSCSSQASVGTHDSDLSATIV